MSLFYQPRISDGMFALDAEESRHATKVLRLLSGNQVNLTDGKGMFYQARIIDADSKKTTFEILSKKQAPKRNYQIHIAISPTKNTDRIEWFVEKATEIGVDEISFIHCRNSERKTINLERIEKIAISALKQSQQAWMPKLNSIVPFKESISISAQQKFIAFVDESNTIHLKSLIAPEKNYLVLIGPEGDFSKEELEIAIQHDFKKVSLGQNRLRTETAALAACQTFHFANEV